MASEFSVRCACKFRRLTGGKSMNLQDVDDGKGTARCAVVLCGISINNLRFPSPDVDLKLQLFNVSELSLLVTTIQHTVCLILQELSELLNPLEVSTHAIAVAVPPTTAACVSIVRAIGFVSCFRSRAFAACSFAFFTISFYHAQGTKASQSYWR